MAARDIAFTNRKKVLDSTFDSSQDSSIADENAFGQAKEDEEDQPVVFICGKCKLPVGDSLSWDGSDDVEDQIRLKRVTDNVVVGEADRMYEVSKRSLCLVVDLFCRGCNTVLGMVYTSTPKSLDSKRFAFCFNVADIDSYELGSASQMLAAEGPKEQLVTLEYRSIVEQQLREMKMMVMSMAQRMGEIDSSLQDGCDVE